MRVIDLRTEPVIGIAAYRSSGAASAEIGSGTGPAHAHVVRIEAGGMIGPHEAGFGQLFHVVSGVGWVAGQDHKRHRLEAGQAAFFSRGEVHSKGAEADLLAFMFQVEDFTLRNP
jgi:quercetin dioxygenase-like cupin family protein